ncbi:apoptosis facilitator Bcl-2-like protein 14 isoform X2 [Lates calcarifer]|uniref:Apoptosis facilitator Bcl-2-like protein 14 isoform X2 n=1 Tax=Lates calcarifer TaxID=8187 RepID=A0AAJ8BB42_LATCA|nr:apoptosis facilitator Bcl-2-like protein 14 isoform X2 [Lates calcarifer]
MASASAVGDREVFLLLEEYCCRRRRSEQELQPTECTDEVSNLSTVVDRLVQITDSAPVPEVVVENQDEIIQKLVDLMITFGDNINERIRQSTVLQRQLSDFTYDAFEKLTSSVQNLLDRTRAAPSEDSEERIQQRRIAWAFEVTSRLSATGVIQRRRMLSFGERYIQQHHSAWVLQHGGWEEVFAVD